MRRFAIFCDGTWNKLDAVEPTNVVIAAKAVRSHASDGIDQIIYYNEGVGTTHIVAEGLERKLAGAFGLGLLDKIGDAYRFLSFNYEPGDEIYIFGFSRGAFTARSLAGMIRKCGVLRKEHVREIGRAFTFYKNEAVKPADPEAAEFRRTWSYDEIMNDAARVMSGVAAPAHKELFGIRYLGVWDTVGALGIPKHLRLNDLFDNAAKYRFHDPSLSSIVESARHAVAIDEDRKSFVPTLWDNMEELNRLRPGNYLQLWFPGDHGSVGGGGNIRGLSNEALMWIVAGARRMGLEFDVKELDPYDKARDWMAALRNMDEVPPFWKAAVDAVLFSRAPREGLNAYEETADSTRLRVEYETKSAGWPYRPKTLAKVVENWKGNPLRTP